MSITIQKRVSNTLYRQIKDSGFVTGWNWTVFNYIWQRHQGGNGTTSTEAIRDLPNKPNSTISARFTELECMRAIKVVDTKLDPVAAKIEVRVYEPTYQMPIPLSKKRQFWILRLADGHELYLSGAEAKADFDKLKASEPAEVDLELISTMERLGTLADEPQEGGSLSQHSPVTSSPRLKPNSTPCSCSEIVHKRPGQSLPAER